MYFALSLLDHSENIPGVAGLLGFAARQLYQCLPGKKTYLTDCNIFNCAIVRKVTIAIFLLDHTSYDQTGHTTGLSQQGFF